MAKKILIVDDEANARMTLADILTEKGYEAMEASSGENGLEKAGKENPDLILLDIKMAQMDGYTMLRRLKQAEKTKSIPVIMLTAYDKMDDLFKIEGVTDFIVKPFDSRDLLLRITRAIK